MRCVIIRGDYGCIEIGHGTAVEEGVIIHQVYVDLAAKHLARGMTPVA